MNLTWLEDFLALAATGNFSRAAEERHMTQPAFSRRVRALEEWLGVELFDRSSQPARLTAAGEWLRPQAEELLARVARLPPEARAVAESNATTLRLAATHALSFSFVPGWLQSLQAHTARGPIRLVSDVLQRCEALLAQRQVQFVIAHAPTGARGELAAAGLQAVFTAHLASVLKTMALEARGLAWLPQSLVREELADGRLRLAGPPHWRIAVEVRLYRDPAPLGAYAEAFWQAAGALAPRP